MGSWGICVVSLLAVTWGGVGCAGGLAEGEAEIRLREKTITAGESLHVEYASKPTQDDRGPFRGMGAVLERRNDSEWKPVFTLLPRHRFVDDQIVPWDPTQSRAPFVGVPFNADEELPTPAGLSPGKYRLMVSYGVRGQEVVRYLPFSVVAD